MMPLQPPDDELSSPYTFDGHKQVPVANLGFHGTYCSVLKSTPELLRSRFKDTASYFACKTCLAHPDTDRIVPPVGCQPETSTLIVVGRNPGRVEDDLGVPLIGQSGAILGQWMDAIGQSFYSTVLTNLFPLMTANDRLLTSAEINHGLAHLARLFISLSRINTVLALGAQVNAALGLATPLSRSIGDIIKVERPGLSPLKVVCCIHPASLRYGSDRFGDGERSQLLFALEYCLNTP